MGLDDLLEIARGFDDEVRRMYTYLAKRLHLEDFGNAKYWFCGGLGLLGQINLLIASGPLLATSRTPSLALHVMNGLDTIQNVRGISGNISEKLYTDSEMIERDMVTSAIQTYNRIVSPPAFLFGVTLLGIYALDFLNSTVHGTPMKPESSLYLQGGLGLLACASSMYLKDTDTKLLDRDSALKREYELLKEKVRSMIPDAELPPVLVPVPVRK